MKDKNIYYNYNRVMSYNAFLNFIIGERGVGKSYGIKAWALEHYLKTGKKFIYLRRFDTELKKLYKDDKFFKDIKLNERFSKYNLTCRNGIFYIDGKVCGYGIPLTKSSTYKSDPFPDVDLIIFDEFLINNKTYHYLDNEPVELLEFIETVTRLRDIKVFMLGNNTTIANPYFNYFGISVPYKSDIKTYKNGLILINYIENEKYREVKKKTRFGKLIEGTRYGDYAIDNKSLLDNAIFIEKKTPASKYFCTIIINGNTYGVWNDYYTFNMYINKMIDNNCPIKIAFNIKDHTEKTTLASTKSVFYKNIYNHYIRGNLFFDSEQTKSDVYKIITKTR